jgi:hypothetical protein
MNILEVWLVFFFPAGFVNTVVEGSTDLGYWNMLLSRIDRLDLGSD